MMTTIEKEFNDRLLETSEAQRDYEAAKDLYTDNRYSSDETLMEEISGQVEACRDYLLEKINRLHATVVEYKKHI